MPRIPQHPSTPSFLCLLPRVLPLLLSALLLCFTLSGCGNSGTSSPTSAPAATEESAVPAENRVEIWTSRDIQQAAVLNVAQELGYFDEEGVAVTVRLIESGTDLPQLAAEGSILFFIESSYTSAIVEEKGVDIRYVMPLSEIGDLQGVVLGPDVDIDSPKDLEDKIIGMTSGAGVGIAIANMADTYGIDYDQLEIVNLQPHEQLEALAQGEIDAMAAWEPWVYNAQELGGKLYFTGNRSMVEGEEQEVSWLYMDSGLNVNGPYADANPETVKAIMRALLRAEEFIASHPTDEVVELVNKELHLDLIYEPEVLTRMYEETHFSTFVDDTHMERVDQTMAGSFRLGYASRLTTAEELYDLRFLRELAPDQVQVETD